MDNCTIKIDGDLTTEIVRSIREQCSTASSDNTPITFNLAQVTKIDNDGLLLLLQLHEYSKTRKLSCSLEGLSADLEKYLKLIGINDKLVFGSGQ